MCDRRPQWSHAALIIGLGLLAGACEPREPAAAAFVEDRASLLAAADEASISSWHAALLRQYDIDYRVLTVDAADDLSALAVQTFETLQVGQRSGSGRGLLLAVDAGGERVRLEVSRELEGVFVDAFVAFVEREQMAPFFAAGRVGDGIVATTELIAAQAEAAIDRGELVGRAAEASSAGAGAESRTATDGGYERPRARATVDTRARPAPLETVAAYVAAMAAHDASAELDLYTAETRQMLAGHVVTRAQMDNLVRTYRACPSARVRIEDDVAVVDHPGQAGGCAPWLLRRADDGLWRLDLLTMQRALRFDTRNRWQVADPEALGDYASAFER
jgi:uncharacterized protein